jgi:LuxR family maltose regulon positive regulatory protein
MTISTLINDLAEAPAGAVIVLDDYHELQGSDVHEVIGYFIDNMSEGLVLVIITRTDPPLPLSRLRADRRLVDIRGKDLRFSEDEVAEYFKRSAGLDLTDEERHLVTQRSEGWVAALQLASLGIDPDDPQQIVDALSAEHQHIVDYLLEEVLAKIRPELADFMIETATFDRFDSRLCKAVMGADAQVELILEIERQNAFLIPLGTDSGWYRYHHLFAELLRSRLKRSDPDRQIGLLIAAANVCEERGLADDAINYALRAGDVSLAADIVNRNIGAVLGSGEVARLRSWLRRFPVPVGPAAHVVALGSAWCQVFEGNLTAATELVDRIEADHLGDFEHPPTGQLEIIKAIVAFQAGDAEVSELHARRGLEMLEQPSEYLECLGHLYIGRALYARSFRDEARPHFERSASLAKRGNTFAAAMALFWLGVIDLEGGNLAAAEHSMKRSQEIGGGARESDGHPNPAGGIGDIGLAFIRLNQLDTEDAIRLAERGGRLLERSTFVEMMFRAFFVWSEALSIAGRFDEAEVVAQDGLKWLYGRSIGGSPLETWLWMSQTRNFWRQGKLDEANELLSRVRNLGLGSPNDNEIGGFYEAADVLTFALRRGDLEESRRLLATLPTTSKDIVMFAIKRQVLTSAVHELGGEPRLAVETLERAIDLAQSGYRYQFSHVGPLIRPTLDRMVGRTAHDQFLRSIVDKLPIEANQTTTRLVDPLTDRELDVLAEVASGYTNDEIAERLFISRGTVKRHVSNIFLKLGVHHRAEAAAKGRELGLLT